MGQLGQMLAGPRALLGGLCRLVGQITNITDVACDLFGNAALLLARCGDLRGHIIDALHRITGYAQRLIHARRLMLAEGMSIAQAAGEVGYISVSQFTREYARLYGAPPGRDRRREKMSA